MKAQLEVLGNNLLIKNPFYKKEKPTIHVEAKVQEEMLMAEMAKTKRLRIEAHGCNCLKVKTGDEVYIDTDRVMSSIRVVLNTQGEEGDYFIVRETDVIFIYKDSITNIIGDGNALV